MDPNKAAGIKALVEAITGVSENQDSLTIGAPSGGQVKVYGDFADAQAFRRKLDAALGELKYAQGKVNGGE